MCGRYAATARPEDLVEEFEVDEDLTSAPARSILATPQVPSPGEPDYNMAPTKQAPVIVARRPGTGIPADEPAAPRRQLRLLTWGLVPSWAKDTTGGPRMINARAETLGEKPAFARIAGARRCLVPATGWYEWQHSPVATDAKGAPRKQPFFVHRADGEPLALAGLYEFWRDPSRDRDDPLAWLATFTIVTQAAEPGLDRLHDRQPVVLDRSDWRRWLDPDAGLAQVADLLAPSTLRDRADLGRFAAYPVTTAVNGVRNNGPHLLDPAPRDTLAGVVDPTTGEILDV